MLVGCGVGARGRRGELGTSFAAWRVGVLPTFWIPISIVHDYNLQLLFILISIYFVFEIATMQVDTSKSGQLLQLVDHTLTVEDTTTSWSYQKDRTSA
jgi:hypothetical protein